MTWPEDFQKCATPACNRQVKTWVQYCCGACAIAHEGSFEIHEHTALCDGRDAERGPYVDPWMP